MELRDEEEKEDDDDDDDKGDDGAELRPLGSRDTKPESPSVLILKEPREMQSSGKEVRLRTHTSVSGVWTIVKKDWWM